MKNWKSCPENWKIREKLKVLFCDGFMHDSFFFVLFVIVVKKFSEKKIVTITKESRKIRANCKNYNFCMLSRS
jgi:hypothetical protein